MAQFTSHDPRIKAGRARAKELAAEMKAAIQINVASLLTSLGRDPTELERMQAEMICSLFLRARRLRENGRNDLAVLRHAANLMRESAFRSPATVPATE